MIWVILIVIVIELAFSPRLDKTRNGDLLLWYGRNKRKYIKII